MSETPQTTARCRTRFARVYADGSMNVMPATADYFAARKEMIDGSEDDDIELVEIEVTVIRHHGKPQLQTVREHSATCPCCGELVSIEVPTSGQ